MEGASQGVKHYGEGENVITSCFACQTGSAIIFPLEIDRFAPFSQEDEMTNKVRKFKMWKRRKSINYRPENAGTSWFGSKTGSDAIFNFTITFRIQRNLLPEKTARIKQLQAGISMHFLSDEQNRKWSHLELAGKCWHFLYSSKVCWLPSLDPTDVLLAKDRICLLAMLGGYSEKQKLRRWGFSKFRVGVF